MLVIPNLFEASFYRIDASLTVPLDQLTESDHENHGPFEDALTARLPGERDVFATIEMAEDSKNELQAWLSFSFRAPPSKPELADLASELELNFSIAKWKQSDSASVWNPLCVFLDKTVNLFVKASFTIDRDELADDSLVASMIGLRTKAGEEQFLLSGAQFAVRGFPEDRISWYLKPGTKGQKISGEVTRTSVEQFHAESISDVVHVIEARFSRIVHLQSNISSHVTA